MDYTSHYSSPLGGITLASDGSALIGLWFDGQHHFAEALDKVHKRCDSLTVFDLTRHWLDTYFSGQEPDFTPPLSMRGSEFRHRVWEILLTISFGETMTYGSIAHAIATQRGEDHMSAQAIGGAIGHNGISLIVPCHRVVGSNGSLTGYAGGLERKERLLLMERECILKRLK